MPNLDRYEMDGIAEPPEDYDPEAELEARLRAERELDDRDAAEGRAGPGGGRVRPRALEADDDDDQWRRQQRRRRAADRDEEDEDEEVRSRWHTKPGTPTGRKKSRRDDPRQRTKLPLTDPSPASLPTLRIFLDARRRRSSRWTSKTTTVPCASGSRASAPRLRSRRKFSRFLRKFTAKEDGELVYRKRIREMCVSNRQSLEVSYLHLSQREPMLAIWVADAPADMLEIFNGVAKQEALKLYPAYESIVKDIFVRVTELPILDQIRDIRQAHLNCLIKISGVVTRRTGVFPQLQEVMYDCGKCGFIVGPIFQQKGGEEIRPGSCPECQSKGPWKVNTEKTVYRNYQRLTLQESPGNVPAGRLPRSKEIILLNDLIDQARPGDEIEVTGCTQTTSKPR